MSPDMEEAASPGSGQAASWDEREERRGTPRSAAGYQRGREEFTAGRHPGAGNGNCRWDPILTT